MAGRGPAPGSGAKSDDDRRRRNSSTAMTVVTADGKQHGKDLPDTFDWPQATLDWWETWRTCAQASKFTDTDWSFLLDTAVLHAEFWLGNRSLANELRLRAAKFGATPEDRARLKIEVGNPDAPKAPTRLQTKETKSRRTRLLRAVGDDSGESADE
ncbi:phage terminase small subunit [Mycolicibacterium sp. XJ775]